MGEPFIYQNRGVSLLGGSRLSLGVHTTSYVIRVQGSIPRGEAVKARIRSLAPLHQVPRIEWEVVGSTCTPTLWFHCWYRGKWSLQVKSRLKSRNDGHIQFSVWLAFFKILRWKSQKPTVFRIVELSHTNSRRTIENIRKQSYGEKSFIFMAGGNWIPRTLIIFKRTIQQIFALFKCLNRDNDIEP
jgi:hypothetical protein